MIPIEVGCRGFIGHSVISFFKNRNHWSQFESCLESSLEHGAICIKLDLVESEKVFSMKVIHEESPFPCDYVRNGYCKRVITSTAESKRVF